MCDDFCDECALIFGLRGQFYAQLGCIKRYRYLQATGRWTSQTLEQQAFVVTKQGGRQNYQSFEGA